MQVQKKEEKETLWRLLSPGELPPVIVISNHEKGIFQTGNLSDRGVDSKGRRVWDNSGMMSWPHWDISQPKLSGPSGNQRTCVRTHMQDMYNIYSFTVSSEHWLFLLLPVCFLVFAHLGLCRKQIQYLPSSSKGYVCFPKFLFLLRLGKFQLPREAVFC